MFISNIFLIKLGLSFLVGGLYIALTTWAAEKLGSKIGGILIGLPLTLLVSLIFIAWTQSTNSAVAAIPIVPAAIAADSIFIAALIKFFKHGKITSYLLALFVWFFLTFPLVFIYIQNIWISLFLATVFFSIAILYLRKFPDRKIKNFKLSSNEFLFRVLFFGTFISLSVLLGKILGPLWGGLFASFPAAFSSSLLILEQRHGIDFMSSVAKTMPYGSIANVLFATTFYFITPWLGILYGILISYSVALISVIVINKLLKK